MQVRRIIETWIDSDPATIFDILADLHGYGAWLPRSAAFWGTSAVAEGKIGVGTTYRETSPWGIRHGRIVAFDRPTRIAYSQPMTLRPGWLGTIDVLAEDSVLSAHRGTVVRRRLSLGFSGPIRLAEALVTRSFVAEIRRTQHALRAHVLAGGLSTARQMPLLASAPAEPE